MSEADRLIEQAHGGSERFFSVYQRIAVAYGAIAAEGGPVLNDLPDEFWFERIREEEEAAALACTGRNPAADAAVIRERLVRAAAHCIAGVMAIDRQLERAGGRHG